MKKIVLATVLLNCLAAPSFGTSLFWRVLPEELTSDVCSSIHEFERVARDRDFSAGYKRNLLLEQLAQGEKRLNRNLLGATRVQRKAIYWANHQLSRLSDVLNQSSAETGVSEARAIVELAERECL